MKISGLLLLPLLLLLTPLSAQQIEFFGGVNSNHMFDSPKEEGAVTTSDLSSDLGYAIGFSFDNPNMYGIASRISVSYNKIKGNISTSRVYAEDDETYTNAQFEKNSINVAVYPFTFIIQRIYFGFGLQGNLLLDHTTSGELGTITNAGTIGMELTDESAPTFHSDLSYGVTMRTHYNIMLNNGLSIVPKYNLYYGINEEYSTEESEKIKVWQQVLALGIAIQL